MDTWKRRNVDSLRKARKLILEKRDEALRLCHLSQHPSSSYVDAMKCAVVWQELRAMTDLMRILDPEWTNKAPLP